MAPSSLEPSFIAAFAAVMVFGMVSTGFFYFNKNAALKRKLLLPFLIGNCLLLVGVGAALGLPVEIVALMAFVGVLSCFMYTRSVRFCDACGTTNMSANQFSKPVTCFKCGANLK
jgi:hypothetical protein